MKPEDGGEAGPLLRIAGLRRTYLTRRGWARRPRTVRALDGVDLELAAGSTTALVGESGSGKSTLARCVALLERPDAGTLRFEGADVLALDRRRLAAVRRRVQLIFQDPASSLSPRLSAVEIVSEPLAIQKVPAVERRRRALQAMEHVGLLARWAARRPGELSGGQRQRLAIARALVLRPRLLILDEAMAALDLSVQARIVNLLLDLQSAYDLTYLYVSHDLSLVRVLASEVAVLERGRIVERGSAEGLFHRPRHPHTRALLAATPGIGALRRPA